MDQGGPPVPANEEERLARLERLGVLDTAADPAFDRLTRLAARHFATPMALVSLVDRGRQWFKSRCGLDVGHTSRRVSFCAHAILADGVMVVPDACADARFADNPLVTGHPNLRFYAGAPLLTPDGFKIGTFCVLDTSPRSDFGKASQEDLAEFARIAMHEMEIGAAWRAEREARAVAEAAKVRLRAAKAEAERADHAKSKFLAAASHDLRQPVHSLLLLMGALEGKVAGTPAAATLAIMGQALDGLRTLLDSLLDVSRLDAGLVVAKRTDIPVGPFLEHLAREYGPRADAKGLVLRAVSCTGVVRSDPVLLERILRNFLENALAYTEQGSILIGCRRGRDTLKIAVVDTGIGIQPERQGEIFEEFVQLGNPGRDRAKGLGLGLAVVRRMARLLGHEILLRSRPGRGSSFSVVVPLARGLPASADAPTQPPAGEVPAKEAARPLAGGVLLLVDDEVIIRLGMQALASSWGYEVMAAGSLAEALALLEKGPEPDLILTDFRLRGSETGLDVLHAVEARLGRHIPGAIVTGDTAPERLAEAHAGGYRLLHKPVPTAEFRAVLADLLSNAPPRSGVGRR